MTDGCDTPGGVHDLPVTTVFAVVRDCGGRGSGRRGSCTRTPFAGGASAEELLARALEVIEQQSVRIDDLARQNAELREQNAQLAGASEELRELVGGQAAQLAEANATIAVLQRIVFGRSSEKSGPAPDGDGDGDDAGAGDGGKPGSGKKKQVKRG